MPVLDDDAIAVQCGCCAEIMAPLTHRTYMHSQCCKVLAGRVASISAFFLPLAQDIHLRTSPSSEMLDHGLGVLHWRCSTPLPVFAQDCKELETHTRKNLQHAKQDISTSWQAIRLKLDYTGTTSLQKALSPAVIGHSTL